MTLGGSLLVYVYDASSADHDTGNIWLRPSVGIWRCRSVVSLSDTHAIIVHRLFACHQRNDEQHQTQPEPDYQDRPPPQPEHSGKDADDNVYHCHDVQEPVEAIPALLTVSDSPFHPPTTTKHTTLKPITLRVPTASPTSATFHALTAKTSANARTTSAINTAPPAVTAMLTRKPMVTMTSCMRRASMMTHMEMRRQTSLAPWRRRRLKEWWCLSCC